MKKRKMYLDIDGVLSVWNEKYKCIELSRGFGRLMRFCKIHDIQPYWLSYWCRRPETLIGLNCLLWPQTAGTMAVPEILEWENNKALAIDYDSDFVWIEDGIDKETAAVLREHSALDRFFWTHGSNPDCLLLFIEFARKRLGLPITEDWSDPYECPYMAPIDDGIAREVGGHCF
jgi:hypothetical protein